MPKIILIANTSSSSVSYLYDLFNLLSANEYGLVFYSRNTELKKFCQEQKLLFKKSCKLFSFTSSFFQIIFSFLFLPFIFTGLCLGLIFKFKFKIESIVCFDWLEKIIFTPWAKLLKLKIVWLECPGPKKQKLNIFIRTLLKFFSSKAKIAAFNQKTISYLNLSKFNSKNITLIQPGINSNRHQRQENIFHDLAHSHGSIKKNNFYTIGTIVDLNKDQEIEIILGAIKKALNVIPNLQFIIIGEGKERKNLTWLAKKMEIGNLVWFVGEQAHLHKWLNSFNIFITASKDATLGDIKALLYAMSSRIPVITAVNHGFDDIIIDNENGIIAEKTDSDFFSSAIIKLNQDKRLADKLTQKAKADVNEKYTDKIMMENFINLLA